jgi:hypothetical protein
MWSGAPPHRDRPVPLRTMSAMMGRQTANQAQLFYEFCLEDRDLAPCRCKTRDPELSQDHPGWPIIVRYIPTVPTRRAALTRDARPECPMTTRAPFLFGGTTVSIMARNLRRERR